MFSYLRPVGPPIVYCRCAVCGLSA